MMETNLIWLPHWRHLIKKHPRALIKKPLPFSLARILDSNALHFSESIIVPLDNMPQLFRADKITTEVKVTWTRTNYANLKKNWKTWTLLPAEFAVTKQTSFWTNTSQKEFKSHRADPTMWFSPCSILGGLNHPRCNWGWMLQSICQLTELWQATNELWAQ